MEAGNFINNTVEPNVFWANFDALLKKEGWTLTGFSLAIGLNESTIRSAKGRGQMPLLSTAYAIAKGLNVSLEYLITGVNNTKVKEILPADLQAVINKYATN